MYKYKITTINIAATYEIAQNVTCNFWLKKYT